jgi:hypothetical protein
MKQQFQYAFHCADEMCVLYHIALIIAHSLRGWEVGIHVIISDKKNTKRKSSSHLDELCNPDGSINSYNLAVESLDGYSANE